MSLLNNIKIKNKLAIGFSLLVILIIFMGIFCIFKIQTATNLTEKMYKHPLAVSNAVRDIKVDLMIMHQAMQDLTTAENNIQRKANTALVDKYEKEVYRRFDTVFKRFLGDQQKVQYAYNLFKDWKTIRDELILLIENGDKSATLTITKGKALTHVNNMNNSIEYLIDFANKKGESFYRNTISIKKETILLTSIISTLAVIFSVLVGIIITRNITVPLNIIMAAAKSFEKGEIDITIAKDHRRDEIGKLFNTFSVMVQSLQDLVLKAKAVSKGDLSVEITPLSKNDELAITFVQIINTLRDVTDQANKVALGDYSTDIKLRSDDDKLGIALQNMTNKLQSTVSQNEFQIWMSKGLAQLSEIVRGELKIKVMANSICQFIANYLVVQIITFYVLEDEKLVLTGSYAFSKRKSLSNVFDIGEGFVGQAVLEKQIISITNIPDDYTRINSSIGDSKPRNIVVVPFICTNVIQGVMEIGSFEEISDDKLKFLGSIIEPVGISINAINKQEKTHELLEETQRQSEELQTQQEELKASNENLEEQALLLKESEIKLKQQSEVLRVTNEELEIKHKNLEQQKLDLESTKKNLEIKAQDLTLAGKYKSEFLANMSHELRTPLNSLLILSKGLMKNKKGNLKKDQVEDAKVIYEGGKDLLNLINDILDLSKVEAGMLSINVEEVYIDEVVTNLKNLFNPLSDTKGIPFEIKLDGNIPNEIVSDGLRLEQILKNLLSNAFKFTEKGTVTLKIHLPEKNICFENSMLTNENTIGFSVIDTGIGLPLDKQKSIFTAFHQEDGSTSRKYGGTGLGLAISGELTRALGGEIYLTSEKGKGSTFSVYLPLKLDEESVVKAQSKQETPTQHLPESSTTTYAASHIKPSTVKTYPPTKQFIPDDRHNIQKGDRSILIIEDDAKFIMVLMKIVHGSGFKCLAAGNGESGLYLAAKHNPNGILLDIGLPDINGLKVLDELKNNLKTRHIPVHVISEQGNEIPSLKKGAIGFLAKPASKEDINSTFDTINKIETSEVKSILFVEDNEVERRHIGEMFESKSIAIDYAISGKQACEKILSKKYDCVVLDLGLPDISGFEVLDKISNSSSEKLPHIIIYSAREVTKDEYKQLSRFTSDIIIKGEESSERLVDDVTLFLHNIESLLPEEHRKTVRMLHNKDSVLKDRKILLVDDDMRNAYAMSKQLRDSGLIVIMAENGQVALEKMKSEKGIQLIIMDIMMPVMDGYETMRHIRKNESYANIPIIALTAKAMPEDRDKCLEAGASEYISKPIDMEKLLSIMRVWLYNSNEK